MKNICKGVVLFALLAFSHQAKALSPSAQEAIDDFMAVRMELTCEDDRAAILEKIDAFEEGLKDKGASFTDEENLVMDNFIEMERYNYLRYGSEDEKKTIKDALKSLRLKNAQMVENLNRVGKDASKWLLCTAGDVTSCYISFSMADVIKYGLGIKKLYQKAVADGDEAFSYGLTNIAQWYYWAPKINGGSKEKAAEYFEKAVKEARNKAEKFYAETFWSQWLFESGDKEGAKAALNRAEDICPMSNRIKAMRLANENGLSFFEWDKKHSKLER